MYMVDIMLIKIATAECFTHGNIAKEIHSYSMGYPTTYEWNLDKSKVELSVVAGLFIPTITGVKTILQFEPLTPKETINDIKVYNQEDDLFMAEKMAEAVKKLTGADIGIGTTAGIGEGGIAINGDETVIIGTSDVYADLTNIDNDLIFKRESFGIDNALNMLEIVIHKDFY